MTALAHPAPVGHTLGQIGGLVVLIAVTAALCAARAWWQRRG